MFYFKHANISKSRCPGDALTPCEPIVARVKRLIEFKILRGVKKRKNLLK